MGVQGRKSGGRVWKHKKKREFLLCAILFKVFGSLYLIFLFLFDYC